MIRKGPMSRRQMINALGWGDKVTDMGPVFRDALTAKYGTEELEACQEQI